MTESEEVDLYLHPLMAMSQNHIREADNNMIDYVDVYAHFIARRFDLDMSNFRQKAWRAYKRVIDNGRELDREYLHRNWADFNRIQTSLARCVQNIRRFRESDHYYGSTITPNLLQDYEDIVTRTNLFEREIAFFIQVELSMRGVEEMQTANEIAYTVRVLTGLAFFFIPSGFISSVYGTNLAVFLNGDVKTANFIAAILVTTVGSILIALGFWGWHHLKLKPKRRVKKKGRIKGRVEMWAEPV